MNGIVNDFPKLKLRTINFCDDYYSASPHDSVEIHSTNLSVLGTALNALAALMLAINTRAALVNLDILKNYF